MVFDTQIRPLNVNFISTYSNNCKKNLAILNKVRIASARYAIIDVYQVFGGIPSDFAILDDFPMKFLPMIILAEVRGNEK